MGETSAKSGLHGSSMSNFEQSSTIIPRVRSDLGHALAPSRPDSLSTGGSAIINRRVVRALLNFDFRAKHMFRANLLKGEKAVTQYQAAAGEPFTEKMRLAVLLMMSPEEVGTFLRVQSLGNYQDLRISLVDYLVATDEQGPTPMHNGYAGIGKAKHDRGIGKKRAGRCRRAMANRLTAARARRTARTTFCGSPQAKAQAKTTLA